MRIISGKLGGRRFNPPAHMPFTRPTTDIAKEGLFNVIQNNLDLEGIRTLDLFAGTGSISYELYSRGADQLTMVEKDPAMHDFIKKTAAVLQIEKIRLVRSDVFTFMRDCQEKFGFIFAGPPYALGDIDRLPEYVFKYAMLETDGWFILEHTPRNEFKKHPFFYAERKYGTTIFSIFINNTRNSKGNDEG